MNLASSIPEYANHKAEHFHQHPRHYQVIMHVGLHSPQVIPHRIIQSNTVCSLMSFKVWLIRSYWPNVRDQRLQALSYTWQLTDSYYPTIQSGLEAMPILGTSFPVFPFSVLTNVPTFYPSLNCACLATRVVLATFYPAVISTDITPVGWSSQIRTGKCKHPHETLMP